MALQLGELSIALELENDKFRAGLANAKRDLESVPPAARREMVKVSRVMDEEGRKSGGLLARGINSGLMRNSPLIVAGVGAALAAGAPVMLAAAGTLFAGVGAAAAAQTVEVRSAWTELGRDVRDGAVEDAAVLVPVYVEMADKIGRAFQRMRPELREAFADSRPLIDSTTDGIVALAENAMPGLVRSIERGEPVFEGLESFLASTGQGLGDFFDAISDHSPAAGQALASLGDITGVLLPLVGELLGEGAELAEDVLPAVADALGLTLDVARELGPVLPVLVKGFIALKIAQAAGGWVTGLSTQLGSLALRMGHTTDASGRLTGAVGKTQTVLSRMGTALPIIGAAIIGLEAAFSAAGDAQEEMTTGFGAWFAAVRQGGTAADEAQAKIDTLNRKLADYEPEWGGVDVSAAFWAAAEAAQDYERNLTPVEAAQERLQAATRTLDEVLGDEGATAAEVAQAQQDFERATADSESAQARLEMATHGVTSAMIEQGEQALASIDSGFAYRKSIDDLEDAQTDLNTAIAEHGAGSEQAQRAQLALEEQAYNTAQAYGQQQADLSGLSEDSLEYKRLIQDQMLVELHRLRDAAGPEMKAAIQAQIDALKAGGVTLSASAQLTANLRGQVGELSGAIHEVPGQKFVKIDAPTAEQKQRLRDLGYTVTELPDGSIYVSANTADAEDALAYLARRRTTYIDAIIRRSGAADLNGAVSGSGRYGLATGGPVIGPGTGTSDSIPARLSNGEHVLTAREVRAAGGHGQVMAWRQSLTSGVRYAEGGPVPRGSSAGTAVLDRREGPLFHADTVNVIEGTPQDVAQELAYQARTRGW